ncbi:nitroreductase family protein [Actinopolymorpha pittospori]
MSPFRDPHHGEGAESGMVPNPNAHPLPELHPLLRARWSPIAFDSSHVLTDTAVDLLLEAARWAPSAGNSQPWAFVTAVRGRPEHVRITHRLAPSSRRWAPDASLLVVNVAHRYVEDTSMEFSEFADYDLGQAVAHMTLQAQAMGLACRQFRAFDLDGLTADLELAPGWQVLSMTAVGRPLGESPERERRTLTHLREAPLKPG